MSQSHRVLGTIPFPINCPLSVVEHTSDRHYRMDSESDEEMSSTVSGYGPPIVTGRKGLAPEQVLRGYEGR